MRLFLAAIILVFITLPARAQDTGYYPVGRILALEGSAWFTTGGNKKTVHVEDPVYMHATLTTNAGGKVLIVFIDDTQLTLAENSELTIDEFIFDPYDAEENEAEFSLPKGAFHWLSGMISKRERPNVKITTGIGSIGIRGTKFWAGEIEGGYGVFTEEGKVTFEGAWGTAEIPAGESVFIGRDAPASQNRAFWNSARRDRAIARVTFSSRAGLDDKIRQRLRDNIRERHDWRGRAFPYKPGMDTPVYKPEGDEFFTDEFNEMRKNKGR